ncbi:hypothetical protein D9M69_552950 [compost metagenome]
MQALVAFIAHAASPAHQFDGVILSKALTDPVTAPGAFDTPEHQGQLTDQGTGAAFADHRQTTVEVDRLVRRLAAAPHWIIGPDDQQFARVSRIQRLHLRPDEGQQRQHIHTAHALPQR